MTVSAHWMNRGPDTSSCSPTYSLQGQIYHYIGASKDPAQFKLAILSVDLFDSDYSIQDQQSTRTVRESGLYLMQQLTEILHEVNQYVQSIKILREWRRGDHTPTPYGMVIHADRCSTYEHVRRFCGRRCLELAAIVPGGKDEAYNRR